MIKAWHAVFFSLLIAMTGNRALAYQTLGSIWPDAQATFHVGIVHSAGQAVPPGGTTWDDAFEEAMLIWNDETVFSFSMVPDSPQDPCPFNGRNGVDFRADMCGSDFGSTTLAATFWWSSGNDVLETGIVFNEKQVWDVYSGPSRSSTQDFRRIAVHELGHALGLDHEFHDATIMFPTIGDIEFPQLDDIRGVAALYGDQPVEACSKRSSISLGTSVAGELMTDDCTLNQLIDMGDFRYVDVYDLSLQIASRVTISLESTKFDAYLILYNSDLETLIAVSDDDGPGLNSRIARELPAGNYQLLATTFAVGETGSYTLKTNNAGDTVGFYEEAGGVFRLNNSNHGGLADQIFSFFPNGRNWVPMAADWNGNSDDSTGLYDPVAGKFYLKNNNTAGAADQVFRFGPSASTWQPITGDWNGDSIDTVGFYDPKGGRFYLKNSATGGAADSVFRFGPISSTWLPITGDWNGDNIDTVGFYDPMAGKFYLKNDNTGGAADRIFRFGPSASTWQPITGDWDGDGIDTVGFYDPEGGKFYLKNSATGGTADQVFRFGPTSSNWLPITGNWGP